MTGAPKFIQAVSRRNVNKWHALPAGEASVLGLIKSAVCGAPVLNPGQHRWEFHIDDDGSNRTWGACKSCVRILTQKRDRDAVAVVDAIPADRFGLINFRPATECPKCGRPTLHGDRCDPCGGPFLDPIGGAPERGSVRIWVLGGVAAIALAVALIGAADRPSSPTPAAAITTTTAPDLRMGTCTRSHRDGTVNGFKRTTRDYTADQCARVRGSFRPYAP